MPTSATTTAATIANTILLVTRKHLRYQVNPGTAWVEAVGFAPGVPGCQAPVDGGLRRAPSDGLALAGLSGCPRRDCVSSRARAWTLTSIPAIFNRLRAWMCGETPAIWRCILPLGPESPITFMAPYGNSGCPTPGGPQERRGRPHIHQRANPLGEVLHGLGPVSGATATSPAIPIPPPCPPAAAGFK